MSENGKYKISNDSSDFVVITEVAPNVLMDIRYYSTYNFIGDRIEGYEEPTALLTKEAAYALKKASDDAMEKGFRLKIFDAYRPQGAVDHFVRWAKNLDDTRMKGIFYPDYSKEELFPLGFIAEHSGHSRGSTVDLTLFDADDGTDVDMGSPFDYFGEISHSDYKELTGEQLDNRKLLRKIMTENGFIPLKEEWWHYTLKDEPYPDTYFSFPVKSRI